MASSHLDSAGNAPAEGSYPGFLSLRVPFRACCPCIPSFRVPLLFGKQPVSQFVLAACDMHSSPFVPMQYSVHQLHNARNTLWIFAPCIVPARASDRPCKFHITLLWRVFPRRRRVFVRWPVGLALPGTSSIGHSRPAVRGRKKGGSRLLTAIRQAVFFRHYVAVTSKYSAVLARMQAESPQGLSCKSNTQGTCQCSRLPPPFVRLLFKLCQEKYPAEYRK